VLVLPNRFPVLWSGPDWTGRFHGSKGEHSRQTGFGRLHWPHVRPHVVVLVQIHVLQSVLLMFGKIARHPDKHTDIHIDWYWLKNIGNCLQDTGQTNERHRLYFRSSPRWHRIDDSSHGSCRIGRCPVGPGRSASESIDGEYDYDKLEHTKQYMTI
jgi:hypothetical protein